MFDKSQLMRGTLEGCILKVIKMETTYGYEIVSKLQEYGFRDVKEGSIYPLLMRLERKGVIKSEFRVSPLGPTRKYYTLTKAGEELMNEFIQVWEEVETTVNNILSAGE